MTKIAVTGKGGVGKTTVAALLAHVYATDHNTVLAIDADPARCRKLCLAQAQSLTLFANDLPYCHSVEHLVFPIGTLSVFVHERKHNIPEREIYRCLKTERPKLYRSGISLTPIATIDMKLWHGQRDNPPVTLPHSDSQKNDTLPLGSQRGIGRSRLHERAWKYVLGHE